jgi:phosphopantothenoylcysteine decarboxylase / phosphopantothenate---cysteine ligase
MELAKKKILLGITGGVAAFKACFLAREMMRQGASVHVVMTEAATHFITPTTFQALTGNPVFTDQWDSRIANNMAHIELSRDAHAIVIAPASADFIAKLVQGRADDLLSTLCLARNRETTPLLVGAIPPPNVTFNRPPKTALFLQAPQAATKLVEKLVTAVCSKP